MRVPGEVLEAIARRLRLRHPDMSPEQIGEVLSFGLLETPAEHMRWAMECREREYAMREANARAEASRPKIVAVRPEPIASDPELDCKPAVKQQDDEQLRAQAYDLAKERLLSTYIPPWQRKQ